MLTIGSSPYYGHSDRAEAENALKAASGGDDQASWRFYKEDVDDYISTDSVFLGYTGTDYPSFGDFNGIYTWYNGNIDLGYTTLTGCWKWVGLNPNN